MAAAGCSIDVDGRPIAVRRHCRARARHRVARRLPLRHDRHQGRDAGRVGRRPRPGLPAPRLFRARRIRRRVRRRHDLALARRKPRRVPSLHAPAGRSWSARRWARGSRCGMVEELRKAGEGERIAGLVLIAPAPDFTTELIEPQLTRSAEARLAEKGYLRGAVGLFRRAEHLHEGAVRGWAAEPRDDRADRHALPGPHPAGPGRSGRAARAMR